MTFSLSLILRALVLGASFTGLCAALRTRFGLNRFVAPCTAACGIIVALMLAGMLGILKIAAYVLYALGLAGLLYAYVLRRGRPEWGLILALALVAGLLAWRYYPCHLFRIDDFSHWGQAARHLLNTDRFPNGGDTYIYFQSYPLGATCFIYYVVRPLIHIEGLYLFAQGMLCVLLFLPVFALVRGSRRIYYPLIAAVFFALFSHYFFKTMLLVDLLLSFFAIGIAASIAVSRDDLRRALIAALPGIAAVALVKNSGLCFSAASALMLVPIAKRCGARRGRAWLVAAGALALPAAAYLLWILHIRLRFPAALASKHAVSLTAYAEHLRSKGLDTVRAIAATQLRALFHLEGTLIVGVPLLLAMTLVLFLGARGLPEKARRELRKTYLHDILIYVVWYGLIFLMYLFSMPEGEALDLTSFTRYNSTGLIYLLALVAIPVLELIQTRRVLPPRLLRALSGCAVAGLAAVAIATVWPGEVPVFDSLLERDASYTPIREKLIAAREDFGLENRGRYLAYYHSDRSYTGQPGYLYYASKYEYETGEIYAIMDTHDEEAPFHVGVYFDNHATADLPAYLDEMMDSCDALVLFDEPSPEFGAALDQFLETYAGDTPVYRAYSPEESASGV